MDVRTYIGGACWISPRNCASASSTFSRVTCRQGVVRTRAPSLSYVSVSHPSKHVVRYSYQSISSPEQRGHTPHTPCAPLCNPRDRSISSFLCQRRPLQCGDVDRNNIQPPRPNILTENTVRERV